MSARAFSPPTALDASPTLVEGQRLEFTGRGLLPESVRAKARQALESGEPLRMTIRALGGHISKPFAFTEEFLQSLAATAAGSPVFRRVHDGSLLSIIREPQVEGVIEGARVVDGGLDEDIAIHGREALTEMAMGVAPTYSIQWRSGPESVLTCSACGKPPSDGGYHDEDEDEDACQHFPGQVLDGQRVNIVFGGRGRLIETTRTYTPAADGTHVRSVQLSEDLVDHARQWLAANPSARQGILRALQENPMAVKKEARRLDAPAPEEGEGHEAYMSRCKDGGDEEGMCQMRWDESRPAASAPALGSTLSGGERAELTRLRAKSLASDEILAELLAEKEERTQAAQRKLAFSELSRTGLRLTVDRLSEILAEPTADGVRELLAATPSSHKARVPAPGDPPEELEDRLLVDRQAMADHCAALAASTGESYETVFMRESNRIRGGGRQGGAR